MIQYLSDQNNGFENVYLKVRKLERRIFTDEEVKNLPKITQRNPYAKEWKMRASSMNRFLKYLQKKNTTGKILELGCGNGWFTNHLSKSTSAKVFGLDINNYELEQADRCFQKENLQYVYGDIFQNIFKNESFDMVVANSSIQYFENLHSLIDKIFSLIKTGGELHFIDSPFYTESNVELAKKRTQEYYKKLNTEQLASHYFHHQIETLSDFNFKKMYDPKSVSSKIKKAIGLIDTPFPWIKILKQ